MDSDVESEKLNEVLLLSESKQVREIPGVILGWVNGWQLALAIDITVDTASNVRQFGDPNGEYYCLEPERRFGKTYKSMESSKV